MRLIMFLIGISLFFLGCGGGGSSETNTETPAFQIALAPSFAPNSEIPVPVNARLVLQSSSSLDLSTINETNIYIEDDIGAKFPAYVTLIDLNIIVKPKVYLTPDATYTIVITTNVANTEGEHLSENATVTFTAGSANPDATPPNYEGVLPDGNQAIETFSKIYFQFDEAISPISVASDVVQIINTSGEANITGTPQVSGSLLIYTPDTPFIPNSSYDISIDFSKISDLAGNLMSGMDGISVTVAASSQPSDTLTPNLNTYNTKDIIHTIEVFDNTLYLCGNNGLHIIAFDAETATFSQLGHLSAATLGASYGIDVNSSANRAYVGSTKGFNIVDISNKSTPTLVQNHPTTAPVFGIDVIGNKAFIAASLQGVIGLDISNETQPQELYIKDTTGVVFDVIAVDSRILATDYNKGIATFDSSGVVSESTANFGHYRNITPHPANPGQYFIAGGTGGLQIADTFSTLGTVTYGLTPSYVTKIVTTDTLAYYHLSDIGIGVLNFVTDNLFEKYIFIDTIDITTFTYIKNTSGTKEYLILVDTQGQLHSVTL